jgi:Zn ribbon nucleic-acid-binding protein
MWQLRLYDMKNFWDGNYDLMTLVKEVEEEPSTDCILEIDGKTYRWCASSPKNKVLGIKRITLVNEPEEVDDSDFTCPYCQEVDHDAWERGKDDDTIECGFCGSEIEYQRNIEVTYTVTPIKRAEILKL